MNIYLVALVIFVTFVIVPLTVAWWMGRAVPIPLEWLADPAPLPGERTCHQCFCHDCPGCQNYFCDCNCHLPRAGYFDLPGTLARYTAPRLAYCRKNMHLLHPIGKCPYDPPEPFPADTGPLLILSEKAAANAALEREIPRLCAEAEAKIPPRWR